MHVIFGYVLVVFSSLLYVLPSLHIFFAIWFLWFGCLGRKHLTLNHGSQETCPPLRPQGNLNVF